MGWPSVIPSFLASVVEFIEALTIILVVGVTINWKSSLLGAGVAVVVLAALVTTLGTALVLYIPIHVLQLVIGVILVLFGMQWLKKALLRFSGIKALHDEAAIYEEELSEMKLRGEIDRGKFNSFGAVTAFKSTLLEGLEVAFIVITFGSAAANRGEGILYAALGASAALALVVILGLAIRKPLVKVPENTLKFFVGVMLVTFGVFWSGEGMGIRWPLDDLFIVLLALFLLALSYPAVQWLKRRKGAADAARGPQATPRKRVWMLRLLKAIFDFFCGDWYVFWAYAATLAAAYAMLRFLNFGLAGVPAMVVYIAGTLLGLGLSLRRETRA